MKKCHKCNIDYVDEVVFCPKCGSKVEEINSQLFCPYCGKDLSNAPGEFCPYCGHKIIQLENHTENKLTLKQTEYTYSNKTFNTNTPTDFKSNNTDKSEESSIGSFLKKALSIIGIIFLLGLSKACGRGLVRGTTSAQKGFFIGAFFAGIVSAIIPAFVAYKYCKFDDPSTAAWGVFILQVIVAFLSAYGVIPIGSIPIGIVLAIMLYCFNHK